MSTCFHARVFVDMFLTAILRTGTKNDYLFHFLVPRGISRETHPSRVVTIGLLLPPLNLKGLRDEIRAEDCSEKRQRGSDQEW